MRLPTGSEAAVPGPAQADTPAAADTRLQAGSEAAVPAPAQADKPAAADTWLQAGSEAAVPAPAQADKPAAADMRLQAGSEVAVPAPAQADKPGPLAASQPVEPGRLPAQPTPAAPRWLPQPRSQDRQCYGRSAADRRGQSPPDALRWHRRIRHRPHLPGARRWRQKTAHRLPQPARRWR